MAKKGGSTKRGHKTANASGSRTGFYVLVAAALVVGLVVYGFARDDDGAGSGAEVCTPVSGFSDLHGLAIDPERPSRLYAATHHGLMRATNDTDWCRVGSSQDDYMGFSMHPTNGSIFWVSGHERFGGNMGVRQSTDGGHTWKTLALDGVDFHAMAVSPADPDRLWGSWQGEVLRSLDGGHTWRAIGDTPEPLRSFVGHPIDPDIVYAVGANRVLASTDGGVTWTTFWGQPASALAIDPRDPDVMLLGAGPNLAKSTDGGQTWDPLALDPDGGTLGYLAIDPSNTAIVYAATYQTGIYKSVDGGATWDRVKSPS